MQASNQATKQPTNLAAIHSTSERTERELNGCIYVIMRTITKPNHLDAFMKEERTEKENIRSETERKQQQTDCVYVMNLYG